jgi:Tfp pilus assembly protein PilZ
MSGNPVLAVGRFSNDAERGIREAAAAVGMPAEFVSREAARAVEEAPSAVVLPMGGRGAAETCETLRGQVRLAGVPLLGLTEERKDLEFIELYMLGGDDLVREGSADGLARRLRGLVGASPSSGPRRQASTALVASPDAGWRSVMGRALHAGGYEVRFFQSAEGLVEASMADDVKVVVAAYDLTAEGAVGEAARARDLGSKAAWVVVAPPKKMAAVNAAAASLPRAAVADGYAPPENVLFLANDLIASRGTDKRAAPRLLYGTAVSFRLAGRDADDVGFTYNVSEGGLYVRTLAPLDGGQDVWVDLWPPRSERRVRLAGTVAWRRGFGSQGSTVPPGFGVKIVDGLAGDLAKWQAGCRAFAKTMLGDAA